MPLSDILDDHKVVVCVGSGGVGKTTTSAAIALRAARAGKRVLCLTIDPAKRLANSLGLDALDHDPQRINAAVFEAAGIVCEGELSAMMLDMKRTFDALVLRHASGPERAERILRNRIYQYVSSSLAGTQEYMAMEKLYELRREGDWDLIVLDTPPTSNALDFLDAPRKLVGAIDSPVMRWFVQTVEGSAGLIGRGAGMVLKGLSRFTGTEFLELINEFVTEINAMFGGFQQRAQAVYDDLQADDVAFVIVTSPAPPAVAEALYFHDRLTDYGITPRGLLVNRVHAAVAEEVDLSALRTGITAHYDGDAEQLIERMRTAVAEENHRARGDRSGIEKLQQRLPTNIGYVEIPAMETDVHDLAALARVGDHLTSHTLEGHGAAQPS